MEPFLDFGVFELLVASALAWIGRHIYAQLKVAVLFLVVTVLAPAVLVIQPTGEASRWVAAVCLATSLVNAAVLFRLLRRKSLPTLFAELKRP